MIYPDTCLGAPSEPATVVELLRRRACEQPTQLAYTFLLDGEGEEARLTYGELDARARAIATLLQSLDVTGGRVLLLYPSGLDYIAAFFGCLYAGVVAVPAYPPRPAAQNRNFPRLRAIVNDCSPTVALSTGAILGAVEKRLAQHPDLMSMRWLSTDNLSAALANEWQEPALSSHTLAFLQYTSGSTATPKGVMVSHGNLLHNERMISLAFGQTAQSIIVGWLPLYHDMGLIGNVLQPLYLGARCILMAPTAFLQRPLRWLDAIARYKATTSGGPNFAYELCVRKTTAEQRAGLDLSSWTTAFNGAEPVRPETMQRFAEVFGPCGFRFESFAPCYGLAEATLIVTGGRPSAEPIVTKFDAAGLEHNQVRPASATDQARSLVNCGRTLLSQKLVLVEPESATQCGPDSVGEIWVAGPSVTHGYWQRPEETAQTFDAYLADVGAGPFLRTGDLGFLHEGRLFVTGRLKDLIVIRGRNHYPQDIEATVERSHAALRPGCGAAFSIDVADEERLVVVQEIEHRQRPDMNAVHDAIRQALFEEHEVLAHAILLVPPGSIPKTSSGKNQRHACRAKFLANSLDVLHEWRVAPAVEPDAPALVASAGPVVSEIEAWLIAHLAARLGRDACAIDVNQAITLYGLDSLAAIELTHKIETALGVNLSLASVLQSPTIAQVANEVAAQMTTAASAPKLICAAGAAAAEAQPLSHGQQALWFLYQLAPESAAYNLAGAVRIRADLDVRALRQAFQSLVERHATLRTTFALGQDKPVQRVSASAQVACHEIDAAHWSEAALRERLSAEAQAPFDLTTGPVLRVSLFRRAAQEYVVLLVVHHIVADFWSLAVLVHELGLFYQAHQGDGAAPLPPLVLQYTDYVRWQMETLAGHEGERLWSYWQKQLAGDLPVLDLPTDRPPPAVQSYRGDSHPFRLSTELTAALHALSRQQSATLYMTLLAAFQTLLHRYTGQKDILVGSPTAGRTRGELADLVGYFVNPLVLRADLSGDPPFKVLLSQVRQTVLAAFEHQEYPFSLLVERLQPARDASRPPLFQAMFALQKAQLLDEQGLTSFALGEAGARLQLGELALESVVLAQRVAQFDLTLLMAEAEGQLQASLQYNSDLFEAATIERLARHFETLLAGIVAQPEQRVGALPLLPATEREQLLCAWNDTARDYPVGDCLHELFAAQAARTPDAVALVCEETRLTYRELNRRANQLAHYLQRLGVGPESLVGICVERSVEMVVGVLGILKAGGAYVPLDPQYPKERLAFMLADTAAQVLLTQQSLLAGLPGGAAQLVCLEHDWAALEQEPTENPTTTTTADNLAYVIYTSGSTGRPKGVAIAHRSAAAFLHWAHETFTAAELASVLAATSLCFDLSVFELFAPLTCGGTVVVAANALALPTIAPTQPVTLVNTVPSAMTELVRLDGVPPTVQTINLAGEPLPGALVQQLYERATVRRVVNLYGPSEDTTYSTYAVQPRASERAPSIGRPIANTQVYLLDQTLQPVPVGVPGELYLGGAGLARGYLNRPELTAERFVPNPFGELSGARLYRTGDLARYRPNGELEFLGRIDQQVKVRGYRIELGEVEAVLNQHAAISECVVLARAENGNADKRLVAYIVPAATATLDSHELRSYLTERLPTFMVPSAFVLLDALPLTPNGKVDRKALPAPELMPADAAPDYLAPRTPVEELLSGLWCEVLRLPGVNVHANFFDLGGHSLLATQLVARVRATFRVDLPLRALFEAPTVAGLTTRIEQQLRAGVSLETPLSPGERRGDELPLSFAQQRLWFLEQLEPGQSVYNMPAAVRLRGQLDGAALAHALTELVRRHEVLRTTFVVVDGQPVQVVTAELVVPVPTVDLRGQSPAAQAAQVQQLSSAEAQHPFDLTTGPLLRATLLQLAADEHVLLVTIHHIVSDGWSLGVLVEEVATLYAAYAAGQPSPLAELPIQYADYALWQREWLQGALLDEQLNYWRAQLQDAPVLELPTARPRPAVQSYAGASYQLEVSASLTAALKRLSQQEGATLFMTLLAAFQVLLHRYSGQTDIVVGTPVAGRTQLETEALIGFFVNTLALRTDLSGNPPFKELLRRVRETTLEAYAQQDVPFERVVEEVQPERSLSHAPIFQVMLALQNVPRVELRLGDLTVERLEVASTGAKFDLNVTLEEVGESLRADWNYNATLFEAGSVERLAAHFVTLLTSIVAQPEQAIAGLAVLPAVERQRLLVEWNETARAYPAAGCLHELVAAQAGRTPASVAVVAGEQQLSYAELNERANQVAHYLRRLGVGAEARVGVLLERGVALVAGVLGVLKAGGAYVPLDPQYPVERLAFMLKDAGVQVLLTQEKLADGLAPAGVRVLYLEQEWQQIEKESTGEPVSGVTVENLAYVIYTSGSTGRPKGVMVSHRSIVNHLLWRQDAFPLGAHDRFLHKASISFDIAVWEIFGTLLAGAQLVLARPGGQADAAYLVQLMKAQQVTVAHFAPAMLHALLSEPGLEHCRHLQQVFCGGELLPAELAALFHRKSGAQLHHQYGPTETTVDVTVWTCARAEQPRVMPIGRPIANTQIYLLDDWLQPVPVGVTGELYIGGASLARGYLNDPEGTAARFIPHPYSTEPGQRLYRTGDLARYLPTGEIEFLGRIDQQVKVRGFRIELGEIEAVLKQHADVSECVVVARADDSAVDKRLVAYVVAAAETSLNASLLRAHLKEQLPEYMLPAAFVFLAALPMTPHSKIDRRALPDPDLTRPELTQDFVAPRTTNEELLAGLWADLLRIERVGVHDNFFELGGHSLLATRLMARIQETFRVEVPLRSLFEAPNIASLALSIEQRQRNQAGPQRPKIQAIPRGKKNIAHLLARLEQLSEVDAQSSLHEQQLSRREVENE
jgi:amino acid adenylation domain-containing protein